MNSTTEIPMQSRESTNRQSGKIRFSAFMLSFFLLAVQQVNQFDIGYRPHIEKHNDKEDDCKAKYRLSKCSSRKYDLKFIQFNRKEF